MMKVRSCSFLLTMMGNHVHNPNANAHRLNHKLSCMVRAKTDDPEQRRNSSEGPRKHDLSLRGAFSLVLRMLIANVGARVIVASLEPLSIGGRLSSTHSW